MDIVPYVTTAVTYVLLVWGGHCLLRAHDKDSLLPARRRKIRKGKVLLLAAVAVGVATALVAVQIAWVPTPELTAVASLGLAVFMSVWCVALAISAWWLRKRWWGKCGDSGRWALDREADYSRLALMLLVAIDLSLLVLLVSYYCWCGV